MLTNLDEGNLNKCAFDFLKI